MDAEEIERAALVGISEGASMSALFAATYPDRVSSLVLWEAGVGPPASEEVRAALLPWVQDRWGSGEVMSVLVRVGNERDVEGLAKLERYSMSAADGARAHGHEFRQRHTWRSAGDLGADAGHPSQRRSHHRTGTGPSHSPS